MINTRLNVFETNSSSSHSFTISISTSGVLETIAPNSKGEIVLKGGDFSRSEFYIQSALEKANAIAVFCVVTEDSNVKEMFEEMMLKHTGASSLKYDIILTGPDRNSYLSKKVMNYLYEAVGSKKDMKDFVFNPSSHFDAEFEYDG